MELVCILTFWHFFQQKAAKLSVSFTMYVCQHLTACTKVGEAQSRWVLVIIIGHLEMKAYHDSFK
jgi:hypothetical protein